MTHTPTTEEVRKGYAYDGWLNKPVQVRQKGFDRWLEAHDREVKDAMVDEVVAFLQSQTGTPEVVYQASVAASAIRWWHDMADQRKEQK